MGKNEIDGSSQPLYKTRYSIANYFAKHEQYRVIVDCYGRICVNFFRGDGEDKLVQSCKMRCSFPARCAVWGKTRLLILVTHHLTAACQADQIIMFDAGRVIGQGTHQTMMDSVPEYTSLWSNYLRSLHEKLE